MPAAVCLPWLQPWTAGPSSSMVSLLASWACSIVLFLAFARELRKPSAASLLLLFTPPALALLTLEPEGVATGAAWLAALACGASISLAEDRKAACRGVALGWLVAAIVSSAYALLQYAGWASYFEPWISAAPPGEAYANLRQRNQFATLTTLGLGALVWLGFQRPVLTVLGVLLLALANAASASRIGLLEWAIILGLAMWWSGPRRAWSVRVILIALVGYTVAAFMLPVALEWMTGQVGMNAFSRMDAPATCGTRTFLWPNVMELIAARPWVGWGWGELDYAHYWHLYATPRFCDILDNAHSLPLHLAVEAGAPLALAACLLALGLLLRSRFWLEIHPHRQLAWVALAAIGAHSLVEYPLWYGPFQMAAGLAIGMLCAVENVPGRGAEWPARPRLRAASAAVAALALSWAAFDYARIAQVYLPAERRWPSVRTDPLAAARGSWLYQKHVMFAELLLTPLTPANAERHHRLALEMLHFSPEPKVIEQVLESALILRRHEVLGDHLIRYRAAFPNEYQAWATLRGLKQPAP